MPDASQRLLPAYSLADPAVLAFVVIPLALVVTFTWGVTYAWRRDGQRVAATRRAVALTVLASTAWVAITALAAWRGVLRDFDRTPPPFAVLLVSIVVLAVAIAFSPFGTRLARFVPLLALVAVQGFRLPLEIAMHAMSTRGIMPEVMSYSGRNFDIVTGITAIVVGALVATGRAGKKLVAGWNAVGLLLLLNVMTVAVLATPRFRYFGEEQLNVWVTYPPFVWLPAVMVPAALAGHLLIFRALTSANLSDGD